MIKHRIKNCTGVILAGGENKRMPVLKGFIKVNGRSILERTLAVYKNLFSTSVIVTNQPELYIQFGTVLLGDIYNIKGPMTGIFTSLLNADHKWVFVSACDMPFINRRLIELMAGHRHGHDAVVPHIKGRPEPLLAFYSRQLTDAMERAILSERRSLKDFLNDKKVKYLTYREIQDVDPGAESLINLNTPQDIDHYLMPQD